MGLEMVGAENFHKYTAGMPGIGVKFSIGVIRHYQSECPPASYVSLYASSLVRLFSIRPSFEECGQLF